MGGYVCKFPVWWDLLVQGYVFYDFNEPEELPKELCGSFDFVLIDPPFITREARAKKNELNTSAYQRIPAHTSAYQRIPAHTSPGLGKVCVDSPQFG